MRIVGGRWAGRALVSPGGRVRPTSEPLRGAWMAILEPDLPGARVVDLFAGTGALGLEALSRGAATCDFVENGPAALHALKANVARFRAGPRARIFTRDAIPFVEALEAGRYEVALADPPWISRMATRIVRRWLEVPFADTLVVEHAADRTLPPGGRIRRFDDAALTVYRASPTTHRPGRPQDD